jgi:DNA-binding CsgD family transcriptional regulator
VAAQTLKLSARQHEVLGLVAHGCSDKEIAERLGISIGTVKTYLCRAYRQNGFRNRAQAAAILSEVRDLDPWGVRIITSA